MTTTETVDIAVLDDDLDFLDLYKEMLSQHLSCLPEVRTASSGARALSMLESEQFDLFIVDLNMPGMDGYAFIEACRATPECAEVPILLATASRDVVMARCHIDGKGIVSDANKPGFLLRLLQWIKPF